MDKTFRSGILEAGDIADGAPALAPRPVLLEGLVAGRDRLLQGSELQGQFSSAGYSGRFWASGRFRRVQPSGGRKGASLSVAEGAGV
jgi:hypothetical protein